MTKSAILSGTDLSKKYGDLEVVKGVSLAIDAGEFACLVGKSGCGVKDHDNSPPLGSSYFTPFDEERLLGLGLNFFRYDSPSITK